MVTELLTIAPEQGIEVYNFILHLLGVDEEMIHVAELNNQPVCPYGCWDVVPNPSCPTHGNAG